MPVFSLYWNVPVSVLTVSGALFLANQDLVYSTAQVFGLVLAMTPSHTLTNQNFSSSGLIAHLSSAPCIIAELINLGGIVSNSFVSTVPSAHTISCAYACACATSSSVSGVDGWF